MDWKQKLTSRKFWMAVVGFVTGVLVYCGKSAQQAEQIAALIMSGASVIAYIIGEGLADAAGVEKVISYTMDRGIEEPDENVDKV